MMLPAAALLLLIGIPAQSQQSDSSAANERISARIVANELRAMNYSARIDQDESGDPRVNTNVDGFDWQVYFYDCGTGTLEDRGCVSYQFYSGYEVAAKFPLATINKWNTEKRYAKAYTYVQRDRSNSARIEIDVLVEGTGSDPAQSFRAYFVKMKNSAAEFRQAIGFHK